jgi:hypothetical protein
MPKKPKVKKPGTVRKVIKPIVPSQPEKVEIVVHGADDLYKEIRIENKLIDSKGKKVKPNPNASVEVTLEADEKDTVLENEKEFPLLFTVKTRVTSSCLVFTVPQSQSPRSEFPEDPEADFRSLLDDHGLARRASRSNSRA